LETLQQGQSPSQVLAGILSALDGTNADVASLLAVTHSLNGNYEQGFQLPVKINGRVSNLSLYVVNEKALTQDGAKVLMSIDTGRLGTVSTYFTINKDSVDINISAPTQEAIDFLKATQGELESLLSVAGASLGTITFSISQENTEAAPIASNIGVAQTKQTAYDYRV